MITQSQVRHIEHELLHAGESVVLPADVARDLLRDYRDACRARALLDKYGDRLVVKSWPDDRFGGEEFVGGAR